jgi:hypothetical protein
MIRTLFVMISVVSVATLLSELLGAGYLWSRGQLNPETLHEIRMILAGEDPGAIDLAEEVEHGQPSRNDVVAERSMRVLELNARLMELSALKNMITRYREDISAQQEVFQKDKQAFEEQLQKLHAENVAESTEQARGVVRALSPAGKVDYLMALEVEQCIVLLKGMPEKEIGAILQEFAKRQAEEQERGRKIFAAIYEGEPTRAPIESARDRLAQQTPPAGN